MGKNSKSPLKTIKTLFNFLKYKNKIKKLIKIDKIINIIIEVVFKLKTSKIIRNKLENKKQQDKNKLESDI